MDDKGEIVSSHDMDDSLSLQIWTKGHTLSSSTRPKILN